MNEIDPRATFAAVPVPLVVLDSRHRICQFNPAFAEATNLPPDAVGRPLLEIFQEEADRRARFTAAYDRGLAGENVVLDREYYSLRTGDPDDPVTEDRWWTVRVAPLGAMPVSHIVLVVEDRTQEVLAERMAEAVTSELKHRTANLSNLVSIIARQSARSATDVKSYSENLIARIEALAQATRTLSGGPARGAGLLEMIDTAMQPFEELAGERLSVDGPDVTLTASAGQALVMGLHELATNAAKYGALSVPSGRVSLSWSPTEEGGLDLSWRESGAAPGGDTSRKGFGTMMLTQFLPMQLQGEAERRFEPDGFAYRLTAAPSQVVAWAGCGPRHAGERRLSIA